MEFAQTEKERVENKQRTRRAWRENNPGNDFEPRYFTKVMDDDTGVEYYKYGMKRDYWEDRKRGDWGDYEDIF